MTRNYIQKLVILDIFAKSVCHYESTPMQYTAFFYGCKNDNFQLILYDYFHIFAQNIYCGYTLDPPYSGGKTYIVGTR